MNDLLKRASGYLEAGWFPLPLPAGEKSPPPRGMTGADGVNLTRDQVESEPWGGNIGLRMPTNVIGLDVDGYGTKRGHAELDALHERLGPLPATWGSTSRDDGSMIRYFRVPADRRWKDASGDIQVISWHYRYAVAPPSIHPEGRPYRWVRPDGAPESNGFVPSVTDLPELPGTWVRELDVTDKPRTVKRDTTLSAAEEFVSGLPDGPMCPAVRGKLDEALADLRDGGSRHGAALAGALAVANLANIGHSGGRKALSELRDAFDDATAGEDRGDEWNRLLVGAIAKQEPTERTGDPCEEEPPDLSLFGIEPETVEPEISFVYDGPERDAVIDAAGKLYVSRKARALVDDVIARETGRAIDWESRARSGADWLDTSEPEPEPLWGSPDVPLWLPGESLTLVGPPSVGKSTLAHMIMWGALGLVPDVLGFPVESMTDGGILYLAMDRPKQIKRAMARFVRSNSDRREEITAVLRDRLTIWEGPLPGDITADKRLLISMCERFGRTRIVVDSIKDVLPNASDEARAGGYNIARQEALAEGLEWVELHHNRKNGAENKEPNTLDDVYGSRWITAGAGSVLSLYGQPGDIVLRLTHLKPLGEPIFPTWVQIERHSGLVSIHEQVTLWDVLKSAGQYGTTADETARQLHGIEGNRKPSKSQIQNVRNKINRLIEAGKVESFEVMNSPLRYRLVELLGGS